MCKYKKTKNVTSISIINLHLVRLPPPPALLANSLLLHLLSILSLKLEERVKGSIKLLVTAKVDEFDDAMNFDNDSASLLSELHSGRRRTTRSLQRGKERRERKKRRGE